MAEAAATSDEAIGWLKFTAFLAGGLAAAYAIYWLIDKFGSGFKQAGEAVSDTVGGAAKTTSEVSKVFFGMSDREILEKWPYYKPGAWATMTSQPKDNPLSTSYDMGTDYFGSKNEPSTTQIVQYSDTIRNLLSYYVLPPAADDVIAAFTVIPDKGSIKLTADTYMAVYKTSLQQDLESSNGVADTTRDIIASYINQLPKYS